jgi:uncharacterized repeat protein (TIGR01451 family)
LTDTATASDPSHYIGVFPSIIIEKATNTEDADDPTGPYIPVGDAVTWSYVITNNGSAPLTGITAVDYRAAGGFTVLSCPDDELDPGEDMTCTSLMGISEPGQFVNVSSVTGIDPFGDRVTDFDPSHYFGDDSAINLEKYTNGLHADEPPGAFIQVGQPVEWTYVVTNIGNTTLTGVTVTDNPTQTITCPDDVLDPDEEMTCTATGVAVQGQYANSATVVGTPPAGTDPPTPTRRTISASSSPSTSRRRPTVMMPTSRPGRSSRSGRQSPGPMWSPTRATSHCEKWW